MVKYLLPPLSVLTLKLVSRWYLVHGLKTYYLLDFVSLTVYTINYIPIESTMITKVHFKS
jgi:hypothetical protein